MAGTTDKRERLEALRRELEVFAATAPPCSAGMQPVFGEGTPDAHLVLVGEAPGGEEQAAGRPFVGRAGRLLDEALASAGMDRSSLWVTNVVKCRPITIQPNSVRNRTPTMAEVRAWLPWLLRELAILHPVALVCLGRVPATVLIHRNFAMTRERGAWFPGPEHTQALATYHPAYLLRQRGVERDRMMRIVVDDLRRAHERSEQANS